MKARDAIAAMLGTPRMQGSRSDASASGRSSARSADGSGAPAAGRSLRLGLLSAVAVLSLAFSAGTALAAGPTATLDPVTNIEYTSAQVSGHVDPQGFPTRWWFEYVTDTQYQENLAHNQPGFANASVPIAGRATSPEAIGGTIEGLHGETKYHLRLLARNVHGSDKQIAEFTTKTVDAPILSEVAASEVEYASAAATGKVQVTNSDPAFNVQTCRFEAASQAQWEAEGNQFPEGPFEHPSEEPVVGYCHPPGEPFSGIEPTGPGTTEVEANFSGLHAATVYHLRLLAQNQSAEPATLEAPTTFTTKAVAEPAVTGPTVSSITPTSAHVTGTVAPNAPEPVTEAVKAGYNVHWFFTCTPACAGAGGEIEAGQPVTEVSADLGLEPNLQYTVTLHAVNAGGDETAEASFSTPAVAPDVSYMPFSRAINRTTTSLRLVGLVNPHNKQVTDCHFEYGTTTSYGQTAPCSPDPSGGGNNFTIVGADIAGLTPGTTYHFRVVATNSVGTTNGEDKVTRTFPAAGPPACGNETIRADQHAEQLPDCRGWEMVTPLDKNGGDTTGEGDNVIAAADGSGLVYASRAGFADTIGAGPVGLTQYLARRSASGWESKGITPTPRPDALETLYARTEAGVFSQDLGKAIFFAEDLPPLNDDIENLINIYQENTQARTLKTVTLSTQMLSPPPFFEYVNMIAVGASADAEVVAFPSAGQLLPEAPAPLFPGLPAPQSVYEWDHGVLRLASVLPDGHPVTEGADLPGEGLDRYRDSVSGDGSRIVFRAQVEGQSQLFLRRNHTSTAWISESEGTTPVASPENVRLQWMSPDGRKVLFTTSSSLVDEDTNTSNDLYLYTDSPNPESEPNLELISSQTGSAYESASSEGVDNDVLGASEDASRIYYLTETEGCGGCFELVYWHNGAPQIVSTHIDPKELGATAYPGFARVSDDGLRLAFLSAKQQTASPTGGQSTEGNQYQQMYVFDASDETLTCASCLTTGTTEANVPAKPAASAAGVTHDMRQVRPNWMTADGSKVFFATSARLVPEDINGVQDVYQYDTKTGERRLLSSGRGEQAAWFEDASASGNDVFFLTRQPLLSSDIDELTDIYDARAGGGFAKPPPPPAPCSGDGCRGPLSTATAVDSPATKSFSGPGNEHRKVKKHHRHHKRHKHGKHGKHAGKGKGAGK